MVESILARYEQAQHIIQGMLTKKLVLNPAVFPHWLTETNEQGDSVFWYQRDTRQGKTFCLVNASTGESAPAFNHQSLADALTLALDKNESDIDPDNLPLSDLDIKLCPLRVS